MWDELDEERYIEPVDHADDEEEDEKEVEEEVES